MSCGFALEDKYNELGNSLFVDIRVVENEFCWEGSGIFCVFLIRVICAISMLYYMFVFFIRRAVKISYSTPMNGCSKLVNERVAWCSYLFIDRNNKFFVLEK